VESLGLPRHSRALREDNNYKKVWAVNVGLRGMKKARGMGRGYVYVAHVKKNCILDDMKS